MWIATNFGWFSAVEDRDDEKRVYVRSRDLSQMEKLSVYLETKPKITKNISADYRYRIHITKDELKILMSELIDTIDYDNFKNSVKDKRLHQALSDVWYIMYQAFAGR